MGPLLELTLDVGRNVGKSDNLRKFFNKIATAEIPFIGKLLTNFFNNAAQKVADKAPDDVIALNKMIDEREKYVERLTKLTGKADKIGKWVFGGLTAGQFGLVPLTLPMTAFIATVWLTQRGIAGATIRKNDTEAKALRQKKQKIELNSYYGA